MSQFNSKIKIWHEIEWVWLKHTDIWYFRGSLRAWQTLKGRLKRDNMITDFSESRGFGPLPSFCLSVSLQVLQLPTAVQRHAREGELGTSNWPQVSEFQFKWLFLGGPAMHMATGPGCDLLHRLEDSWDRTMQTLELGRRRGACVKWMDGWLGGRMDGWMNGWTVGWMGGWMGGRFDG